MKTIKTFRYNEIFVYGQYGERLAGRLQDLLEEDHVIHAFYSSSTGSTRGDGASALFFDEAVHGRDHGQDRDEQQEEGKDK